MPILVAKTCSSCGVGYDEALLGFDIEDMSKVDSEASGAFLTNLLSDLLRQPMPPFAKSEYTEGALLHMRIEELAEVAERVPDSNAWLVRFAVTPVAARLGGRFELRFGKSEVNSPCVVVRMPPDVRPGQTLRVGQVCPDGSDLLIRLEVRHTDPPNLIALAMGLCPACEARVDREAQAAEASEQRKAQERNELRTQIGVTIGVWLFMMMCLLLWIFFG